MAASDRGGHRVGTRADTPSITSARDLMTECMGGTAAAASLTRRMSAWLPLARQTDLPDGAQTVRKGKRASIRRDSGTRSRVGGFTTEMKGGRFAARVPPPPAFLFTCTCKKKYLGSLYFPVGPLRKSQAPVQFSPAVEAASFEVFHQSFVHPLLQQRELGGEEG